MPESSYVYAPVYSQDGSYLGLIRVEESYKRNTVIDIVIQYFYGCFYKESKYGTADCEFDYLNGKIEKRSRLKVVKIPGLNDYILEAPLGTTKEDLGISHR